MNSETRIALVAAKSEGRTGASQCGAGTVAVSTPTHASHNKPC